MTRLLKKKKKRKQERKKESRTRNGEIEKPNSLKRNEPEGTLARCLLAASLHSAHPHFSSSLSVFQVSPFGDWSLDSLPVFLSDSVSFTLRLHAVVHPNHPPGHHSRRRSHEPTPHDASVPHTQPRVHDASSFSPS